ncbi:MAG: FAD-binding oxidoreductase [bacterium]|nr:FAD-binding oxidoreductase [bacterium]
MSQRSSEQGAIVIGAGIIGAAITLELARRGYAPVCLDKNPAAGYGSTSNSCAIVRTHYSTLDGTALAWESYLHWLRWGEYLGVEDERGLARLNRVGMVAVFSEATSYDNQLAYHDQLGIEYEVWDAETLRERVPFYDVTAFHPARRPGDAAFGVPSGGRPPTAVYYPNAGYVNDPQLAAHNLQRAAEAAGARFEFNAEIVEIRRSGDRVCGIALKDGRSLDAPVVVNAAGPYSAAVNRMAGVEDDMNVTTRALRKQVCYLPFPKNGQGCAFGRLTSDDDVGIYSREEVGGQLLVGSLDPECDEPDWVDDPDDFDRNVTEEQWKAQVYRMALRIPELEIPSRSKGCADLYDATDDWIPVYDRSSLDGFYLAVGTSGNQFKNAPMVGQMMAELIAECEAGADHDADPVSLACPLSGHPLDLGFYSRNRTIHRDSSFTVLG